MYQYGTWNSTLENAMLFIYHECWYICHEPTVFKYKLKWTDISYLNILNVSDFSCLANVFR